MRSVGIVAEYNPLHKGHAYHLQKARKIAGAGAVVAVMSGNYTQRGEPAAFCKWQRARWALEAGVDLVIELPTAFAVGSAEIFAMGAISILHRLGVADGFCFGCETDDLVLLERIASLFLDEPLPFRERLRDFLSQGYTLAKARALSAAQILDDPRAEKLLKSPNAILAIEYLKAKRLLHSPMIPFIVLRRSAGYHEGGLQHEMPSATAIRKSLFSRGPEDPRLQGALPQHVYKSMLSVIRHGFRPVCMEDFAQMVFYSLRRLGRDGISSLAEVGEGLENRIYRTAGNARTLEELIQTVKTKRYTRTRLQRILLYALLGIDRELLSAMRLIDAPLYARILGFTPAGIDLLGGVPKPGRIDLVSKAADYKPENALLKKMVSIDVLGSDLYASVQTEPEFRIWGRDFTQPIIKLPV